MSNRNQLIKLIHVAKRKLALEDDVYRLILTRETNKQSCSHMSIGELESVLLAMKQAGFKPLSNGHKTAVKKRLSPQSGQAKHGQIDKIRAIWITMYQHDIVKDRSETALDAYVRRVTSNQIDHVGWCDSRRASQILESLKRWHRRVLLTRLSANQWSIPMNSASTAPGRYEVIVEKYEQLTAAQPTT
ncbi:gp16 family protein [Moritella viscosa]|uniref:Uncharacterized protein n=1 Tax=Moritella viscosa TaxID=80854 RepID=A0ABY1HAS1_9GAMM|nr:regulatory protein GemA [Moritella viscosa]SGY85166.1 Putative uncharacterized protein [Moritella viscosa]SGY87396.1 Putative uncharacterized protein [Moritella viscosa]SHO24710.1 Putative uncharacterized protein [Moritella viscosa]